MLPVLQRGSPSIRLLSIPSAINAIQICIANLIPLSLSNWGRQYFDGAVCSSLGWKHPSQTIEEVFLTKKKLIAPFLAFPRAQQLSGKIITGKTAQPLPPTVSIATAGGQHTKELGTYCPPAAPSSVAIQHWISIGDSPWSGQRWGWCGWWNEPPTAAHSLEDLAKGATIHLIMLCTPAPGPGSNETWKISEFATHFCTTLDWHFMAAQSSSANYSRKEFNSSCVQVTTSSSTRWERSKAPSLQSWSQLSSLSALLCNKNSVFLISPKQRQCQFCCSVWFRQEAHICTALCTSMLLPNAIESPSLLWLFSNSVIHSFGVRYLER